MSKLLYFPKTNRRLSLEKMLAVFFVFVILSSFFSGNISVAQENQQTQACPLVPMPGRTLIHFNEEIRADYGIDRATGDSVATNLEAGTYKVTLVSYDNHSQKPIRQNQSEEQWLLILSNKDGREITRTNPISDLADDQDHLTQIVNYSFIVPDVAALATPYQAAHPTSNANSILAVCAGFDLVSNIYASPDQIINGGFEQEWTNSENAYDWQNFRRGYARTGGGHASDWSIGLKNDQPGQFSGAYQRIDLWQNTLRPVFIGGHVRGENIENDPGGYFGASIYVEIHLADGTVAYWNSVGNFGTFDWRWVGFNTGTLAHVNQPINYIFVVPLLGRATGQAWFDNLTVTEYRPDQSAVTLMFDDGEENTHTEAKPILDKANLKGSTVVSIGEIGSPDFLSFDQIRELVSSGWEIVSHGINHEDLTTLSSGEVINELVTSRQVLESEGFQVNNFALPFGAYNGGILAESAKAGYLSTRAFELGDNPQGTFPYDVKVRGILNTTTLEEVQSWLSKAKTENRWLVLVFHGIRNTGDDAYYTTPETFQDIIDAVLTSEVQTVTYNEGLSLFSTARP
jgi:peptidoglycan/xylan/chitin deacetylase (PgdA/CDA1 family)